MLNTLIKCGVLAVALGMAGMPVFAQGHILVGGRFPEGKMSVFTLTQSQRDVIDLYRRYGIDNTKSQYIFRLTPKQSEALARSAGFSPTLFAIVGSYRGDDGAELSLNVIVRFDKRHF